MQRRVVLAACAALVLPAAAAAQEKPIRVGVASPTGPEAGRRAATLLEAWLSKEMSRSVKAERYDDADALGADLLDGALEVAWLQPVAYVHASARGPGKIGVIRKAIRRGKSAYRSVIFTPSYKPYQKLQDVKGKRIAWLGWSSAAGGIFPRAMLRKAGIDPDEFFSGQVVTSDHAEVCNAVLEGKADVGATFMDDPASGFVDGCGGARGAEQGRLRVLAISDPIPNDALVVRADLDPAVRAALEKALDGIATTPEGKEVLRLAMNAEGLAPATDADFDPVRQAIKIASGVK